MGRQSELFKEGNKKIIITITELLDGHVMDTLCATVLKLDLWFSSIIFFFSCSLPKSTESKYILKGHRHTVLIVCFPH